jgi:hypothetical protein
MSDRRVRQGGLVGRRGILAAATTALLLAVSLPLGFAKDETWRQDGATAFAKVRRESIVISDSGRARLGHAITAVGKLNAERVWDLARLPSGAILAATGDSGKVFRFDPAAGEKADWTTAFDSVDSQVLALAVRVDETVFAGTGPGGQVVNLTDPKHPASRPDPKVQYIWDLAFDQKGTLYAATGPSGQLWKQTSDGKWSLVVDSRATHLLSLAIDPHGSVYAGSDGEGLIYKVDPTGKVSVLFDAPQSEVRSLVWGGDGALYAGTAAESTSSGGGSSRSSLFLSQDDSTHASPPFGGHREPVAGASLSERIAARLVMQAPPPPRAPMGRSSSAGSASPKPTASGENAVYRIQADGVPREVLRAKALIHSLLWSGDRLLAGTGPDGQLYEVRQHGEETAPIAKLDRGQILALVADADGGVIMGTGDPGSIVRLSAGFVPSGVIVSDVHDSKLVSRFGAIRWRGELPTGTSIAFQARTGNVADPDETWSAWSPIQTDPATASVASPPGRFVQYRATLATTDLRRTPELRSVSISYRTLNLAPEVGKLDVPDLSAGDGAAKQARLNLRWDASDPNEDDLAFSLKVKKEGWPDWIAITDLPIADKTFPWDTTAFPPGVYRLKLIATDRPSNSPADALTREVESTSFIVDHAAPLVTVTPAGRSATVELVDQLTRIVKADYSLDGGPRIPIFPDDGLFDDTRETIKVALPGLAKGAHLIMVRATDSAGNVGSGDALIEVKD